MNFTLDGGYNMNSFYSIANEYPNPDALQEFTTTTRNYSAGFGRGTSSVSAVTRSGTNEFHGSAFEFLRNTVLDARYFFAAKRADFKRNQYGGTFGGPIAKNKLFFFVGYQGTKVRGTPSDTRYRTLSDAERLGNFSGQTAPIRDPDNPGAVFPNNQIPASRIRPFARKLPERLSSPCERRQQLLYFCAEREPPRSNAVDWPGRLPHQRQRQAQFPCFYNDVPQVQSCSSVAADWLCDLPTRFQNYTLGEDHIFSPSLINSFRMSYVRSAFGLTLGEGFLACRSGLPISIANINTGFGLTPGVRAGHFRLCLGGHGRPHARHHADHPHQRHRVLE